MLLMLVMLRQSGLHDCLVSVHKQHLRRGEGRLQNAAAAASEIMNSLLDCPTMNKSPLHHTAASVQAELCQQRSNTLCGVSRGKQYAIVIAKS